MGSPFMNAAGTVKLVEQVRSLARAPVDRIVIGSYTVEPRTGNAGRVYASMPPWTLNSLGMPNPGIDYVAEHWSEFAAAAQGKTLVVSLAGFSIVEYGQLAAAAPFECVELNLGCPNVWNDGEQKRIGSFDPQYVADTLTAVRAMTDARVGLKLSPYSDPMLLAEVAAILKPLAPDFLTLSNTFPNGTLPGLLDMPLAGVSGAAIKPIVLGQLAQFRALLPEVELWGAGAVRSGADWPEYEGAGASAVQVGSRFLDGDESPDVFVTLLSDWANGVRVVEQQPPTEGRGAILRTTHPARMAKQAGVPQEFLDRLADWLDSLPPGPPEPTRGNEYATVEGDDDPEKAAMEQRINDLTAALVECRAERDADGHGNEWDRATVDAVVEFVEGKASDLNAGAPWAWQQAAEAIRERFKGAARDTGGRDS